MPALERRRRLTAFVVAMAVLIATPLAVVATNAFTDVADSNVHHDDITWLRDNGVTFGCNPPANDEFCPDQPVLRQQMASFMRRLAENEIVNADTANEADHASTADTAGTAHEATRADLTTLTGTSSVTADSIATLTGLEAGSYIVMGSWNTTAHGAAAGARVVCELSAGAASTHVIAQISNPDAGQESMAGVVASDLAEGEDVNLSCWVENSAGSQSVSNVRVVAYPVNAVESTAVSG